jgi:hypothetical protein
LETQNTCLLLKTADKLDAGHCNPWADWVWYWYVPSCHVVPAAAWSMFQRLVVTHRGLTIVNVGAGESNSFWFDSWSTAGPLATVPDPLLPLCRPRRIRGCRAPHWRAGASPPGSPQLGCRCGPRRPPHQARRPPPWSRARHSPVAVRAREALPCRCRLPDAQADRLLCATRRGQLGQLRTRQGSGFLLGPPPRQHADSQLPSPPRRPRHRPLPLLPRHA